VATYFPTFAPAVEPSAGLKRDAHYAYDHVQFADGYTQRIPWGESRKLEKMTLRWASLSKAEADALEVTLDGYAMVSQPFYYVPPTWPSGAPAPLWILEKSAYSRRFFNAQRCEITCTLERVYQL